MKTLEEFLKEIMESEALQKEFDSIEDEAALEAFFKKNDCSATVDEYKELIKAAENAEGELSDDDAEAAAGGFSGRSFRYAGPEIRQKVIKAALDVLKK